MEATEADFTWTSWHLPTKPTQCDETQFNKRAACLYSTTHFRERVKVNHSNGDKTERSCHGILVVCDEYLQGAQQPHPHHILQRTPPARTSAVAN